MSYDLTALDALEQKITREGTSMFIRTRNKYTNALVHEYEFTNAPVAPTPQEVDEVCKAIRTCLALNIPSVNGLGQLVTPSGGAVGGGGEVDASGLLISTVGGQEFAQLPVGPAPDRAVEAKVVLRHGTNSAMLALDGVANEVGVLTDTPGLVLFTGTPDEARAVYPDNAGRTVIYERDSSVATPAAYQLPSDVGLLILRDAASTPDPDGMFPGLTVNAAARPAGASLRIISDKSPALTGLFDMAELPNGPSDTFWVCDGTSLLLKASGGLGDDGSVALGRSVVPVGARSTLLGSGARTSAANEIGFGSPQFAGLTLQARGHGVARLAGITNTTATSAKLTPSGVSTDPGFPFDGLYANGLYSIRATIIGKRNTNEEFCRFVRDVVVQMSSSLNLTLVAPTTPNTASDIIVGGTAGCAVALAVNNTTKTLDITVTGSTTPVTIRWYAHLEIIKMGNT